MMMNRMLLASFGVSAALVMAVASACTSSGPDIQTLGFLDDYTQLAPGREGQASLIYIDGEADFSIYSAILIEPVVAVAWGGAGGEPAEATRARAKELDAGLRRELAREFELVDQPRAGALKLRAALASRGDSHLVLEVELLDATSGARVVAAVDQRAIEATGEHVSSANPIDHWPILIRNRLATFRQFDAAARAREAFENR